MAEKQNCSESKITIPTARRRSSLPTLSRVLKSQTSSFRHRSCPNIKKKSSGGFKMFLVKAIIGCGAVYLSAFLGIWGEAEESNKIMTKIKRTINDIDKEKILSGELKTDLVEKINKSTTFLKGQLEGIPEELKAYYDKTEQCVQDLIKGKKT